MSEQFIAKIAELGASTFILFIVLVITIKIYNIFSNITKTIDNLSNVISERNQNLSNQMTQCIILQENLINSMKETMNYINSNNVKLLTLESKIDNMTDTIKESSLNMEKTNRKVEKILEKVKNYNI